MTDGFSVEAVEQGVAGTRFSGWLRHLGSVGSTNQLALEAAATGVRDGVWVADEQTAGRGRGGHGWHSAMGDGLYVSVLAAPRVALRDAMRIPLATGLAAQAAVAEVTGLRSDLRWPNDLMLGERKFGGILVESASDVPAGGEASLRYAVIGVGINVSQREFPEELWEVATSLRLKAGRVFAREPLLAALLRWLDRELTQLEEDAGDVLRRFTAASSWAAGKRVRVGEGEGYTGTTRGLDSEGFLRVEDDDGRVRTVLSGGVRPE